MSLVSVLQTGSYADDVLQNAIAQHFETLGVAADLSPDMRVLIKPNLLSPRRPDQAVTTHPALVNAIVQWLRQQGITKIVIADSPGGPYLQATFKAVYAAARLTGLEGAQLNYSTSWRTVTCPEGFQNKSFNLIEPVVEADYIINAAKLKTHAMTTLSGGIKNLFGCIPGLQKPELHYRFPNLEDFSHMLLELAVVVCPQVTVLDAVDAMEGNGPNGGTPKHLGLTFASRDLFTQDWYAATCMGISPQQVSMLHQAAELGLAKPDELELAGDPPAGPDPFLLPDSVLSVDFVSKLPKPLRGGAAGAMKRIFHPLPQVNRKLCIGCGKCAESCPPQIIQIRNGKAHFTKKGCISCFCCQEMCPVHAIRAKRKLNM